MTADRGAFIALVGPDGVGKTSVATGVLARSGGRYFHFRPPILGAWGEPSPGAVTSSEAPEHAGALMSLMRLTKTFLTFWLGYLTSIRAELNRGRIVLADRWAYGYLVHPEKLGYSGPRRLAMWLVRALPKPDHVFALVAEPGVITARKPELSVDEAADEVQAWASLPIPQLSCLDANRPLDAVVDELMRRLDGEAIEPQSDGDGPQSSL